MLSLPTPLVWALLAHRQTQDAERTLAAELWQEGRWMFAQPTGRPIDPRAAYDEWKALLAAAGVRDARLHDARHTAATMLHGESVKTVQSRLGHATAAETLDTYSHLWPDADDTTRTAVDSVLKINPAADTVRTKSGR